MVTHEFRELHRPQWSTAGQWLGLVIAYVGLAALTLTPAVRGEPGWLVPLWLMSAHVMHAHLIAFHEASHGILIPHRFVNDAAGHLLGCLSFMSLTLYRQAHRTHHRYLATERDEELWPFVIPDTPIQGRRIAAFLELTVGLLYTPALFLRAFLRRGSTIRSRRGRRRIAVEMCGVGLFWSVVVTTGVVTGTSASLLIVYLIPALLAGNLQSLRKYTEHQGLFGSTPLAATRSVVGDSIVDSAIRFTLFNEPYHGVHHQFGSVPQRRLPDAMPLAFRADSGSACTFQSYTRAFLDMLPHLRDPRIGPQWLGRS